jgi:diketogulonate reductase-like aldo/keto reductase
MAIVSNIPEVVLSSSSFSNKAMSVIGFGKAADSNDGATLKSAILEAIKLSYRHFNTASAFGSEQALGEGIAQALKLGLVNSREELFITSKLWPSDAHPDLVLPALHKSVRSVILIIIYG